MMMTAPSACTKTLREKSGQMCKVDKDGREKGRQDGRKERRKEGRKEGKREGRKTVGK